MTRIVQLAVVLAIAGVVLITIFPLPVLTAPRTATKGPATTFSSLRLSRLLLLSIRAAGIWVAGLFCILSGSLRIAKPLTLSVGLRC